MYPPLIGITSRLILLVSLFLLSVSGNAGADLFDNAGVGNIKAQQKALEAQQKALEVIETFATRLCITIPQSGSANNLELSGNAKAELNVLIKQITNLGFQGAVKYQNSEWQGVLQQDLAGQLSQARDCKLEVFKELKDKLLTGNLSHSSDILSPQYRIVIESAYIVERGANILPCNIAFELATQCNMLNNCHIQSDDLSELCKELNNAVVFFPDRKISIKYKCRSLSSGIEFPRAYEQPYAQGISIACL